MDCTTEGVLRFILHQLRNASRRFLVGFTLNSGFALLQQLLRLGRKKPLDFQRLVSKIALNRESLSLGTFMACFGFVYKSARRVLQTSTTSRVMQAAVAGAAAGVSIHALTASAGTHLDPTELSLHAFVRAIHAMARQTPLTNSIPHLDSAIFIAACTLIMYCWFFHPTALTKEYRRWITKMAQMDSDLLEFLRQLKDGRIRYGVHTHALDEYCDRHGVDRKFGDLGHGFVSCGVVHPQAGVAGCPGNSALRTLRGMQRALPLYLPVHIIAQLLVHRARIFKLSKLSASPDAGILSEIRDRIVYVARCIARATVAAARSSAFLGAFIGLAWTGVCIARQARQDDLPSGPLLGSFLSGWAIFIESPQRRAELAAYVSPRALHVAWHRLVSKGWVVSIPGAHVSIFALASGLMMAAYELSKMKRSISSRQLVDSGDTGSTDGSPTDAATEAAHTPASMHEVERPLSRGVENKTFSPTIAAILELLIT
jgi:hypothetical protein